MFGIGMPELMIILVIALIVIGPQKLPELARSLGKGLAEFKRASDDFQRSIQEEARREEERGGDQTSAQGGEGGEDGAPPNAGEKKNGERES